MAWNAADHGVYCVVGGMYSVVMNDLIQFGLKVTAAIGVVVIRSC